MTEDAASRGHKVFALKTTPHLASIAKTLHLYRKMPYNLHFKHFVIDEVDGSQDPNMPWQSGCCSLHGLRTDVLAINASGAGIFAFMPRETSSVSDTFGQTWRARRRRTIADRKRGIVPMLPGDLLLMTGEFQRHLQHKMIKSAAFEDTLTTLQKYPCMNARSYRSLAAVASFA